MSEEQLQSVQPHSQGAPIASYEPNMTRVDTGAIRETSAHIRAVLRSIDETQTALQNALRSLEACWEGSAADAYVQTYRKLLNDLAQRYAVYATYPDQLDNHAEVRELVDDEAETIAAYIETPLWAEL